MLIERLRDGPDMSIEDPVSDNLEEDSENDQMDETMNLLCSMDTTIATQQSSNTMSEQQRQKEQLVLDQSRRELDRLFHKLAAESRSLWMREQLTELWEEKMRMISEEH